MKKKHFVKRFQTLPMMKRTVLLFMLTGCSAGLFAGAIEPIPEEDGFSGYVNVGASWMRVKSNDVAGSRFGDLSSDRISSLYRKPDGENNVLPMLNGELRYTFADARTQIFLGNGLEDWLRFDLSTGLGIRKQWETAGIFEGAFLFSGIATEVWEDPYVTGQKREETDRTASGYRLGWGRIFNSNFHLSFSYRDIKIDDERSGESLGWLSPAQRRLLSREGDHYKTELLYVWKISDSQWLSPTLYYQRFDLDGEAKSNHTYTAMLTHTYAAEKFKLVTNLSYAYADYDKRNPIYLRYQNAHQYGISVTAFYPNLFNYESLTGVVGAAYWLEDSDINFHDTEIVAVTVSTMYTF